MSNKIQVFDLSNASDVSLTLTGFKREGESAKYVCKITDATIVFVGDNSKFNTDKKKQFNTITITLSKEQSEEFTWWDKEKKVSLVQWIQRWDPVQSEIESEHKDRE